MNNKFISVKEGVGINCDHITVVRQLTDDKWQITTVSGDNEYVTTQDLSSSAADTLRAMVAGKYHTN